jgi:hypothetical protein
LARFCWWRLPCSVFVPKDDRTAAADMLLKSAT